MIARDAPILPDGPNEVKPSNAFLDGAAPVNLVSLRDDVMDLPQLRVIERVLAGHLGLYPCRLRSGHMETTPSRLTLLGVLVWVALGLIPSPGQAQEGDVAAALVSTPWCHESSTGISLQTIKLRFQPNGVMHLRKDTDLANGSNTASNYSARWELGPGLLILHEANGGQSRLPMTFTGSGRNTRLTLGKVTYAVCR
jgi:hypothetical protein